MPQALLTPNTAVSLSPQCVLRSVPGKPDAFHGYRLCRAGLFRAANLFFDSNLVGKIPFVVYRSDGAFFPAREDWWNLLNQVTERYTPRFNNKLSVVTSENYTYAVYFRRQDRMWDGMQNLRVTLNSELESGDLSPLVRIVGLGSNCSLQGTARVASITALRNTANNAYYSRGNEFYIRLKTTRASNIVAKDTPGLARNQTSEMFAVRCPDDTISQVTGQIGQVVKRNGFLYVNGWACDYGQDASIDVHVYAGGPAGKGVMVKGRQRL